MLTQKMFAMWLQQGLPEFTFANQAGLDMLETTSGALQDLSWEKTLDENGRKTAYNDFTQVLQQVSPDSDDARTCAW